MISTQCPITYLQSLVNTGFLSQTLVDDYLSSFLTPDEFQARHQLADQAKKAFQHADELHASGGSNVYRSHTL